MASTFSFGFSGDDIDVDMDNDIEYNDDNSKVNASIEQNASSSSNNPVFPAERHLLADWTPTLPSQISYSTLNLDLSSKEKNSKAVIIGRRELFDVRTQLMAEDDDDNADSGAKHEELISGLEQGDLKPNFYEGGFKTWECALDLAGMLCFSSDETSEDDDKNVFYFGRDLSKNKDNDFHIVELGCGTAVPSLAVFAQLLSSSAATTTTTTPKQKFRFTMADYNSTVLRLVTLSNFLLTWWLNSPASREKVREQRSGGSSGDNNTNNNTTPANDEIEDEGELDIDSALLDAFQADLASRGITLDFVSGGWSPEFVQLVLNNQHAQKSLTTSTSTLILASETIYAPSSLGVFSETLLELLRNSAISNSSNLEVEQRKEDNGSSATALIAAKKVYFGVGGGVDEFVQVLYQQPLRPGERSIEVQEREEFNSAGVKRVVLQVQLAA